MSENILTKLRELDESPLFDDKITDVFSSSVDDNTHDLSNNLFIDASTFLLIEENIHDHLGSLVYINTNNYIENITKILPFCHTLATHCHTLTKSKSVNTLVELVQQTISLDMQNVWYGYDIHLLLSSIPVERVTTLILITARLEWIFSGIVSRRLLLKDNLMSPEIQEKLGFLAVLFQSILGCVKGFNVKNLAWHGFISLQNIPEKVYSLLFCAVLSLNKKLGTVKLRYRPWLSIPDIKFSHNLKLDKQITENIIGNSYLIHPQQLPIWKYLLELKHSTDNTFTMLSLNVVLLQHVLRRLWVVASSSDKSRVIASCSEFYVTFDEIFSPVAVSDLPRPGASYYTNVYNTATGSLSYNTPFFDMLGTSKFHAFLDIFIHGDGPRLRDKLSHSEVIELEDESLAHFMFDISISLLSCFCPNHVSIPHNIKEYCTDYEHQYHPACQMDVMINKAIINCRNLMETVDLNQFDVIEIDQKLNDAYTRIAVYETISNTDVSLFSQCPLFIGSDKMKYYSLLKQICELNTSFSEIFYQMISQKLDSYQNCKLRSRQRKNLMTSLGMIQVILYAIQNVKRIMLVAIIKTEALSDLSFENNKEFAKLLKQTLKCFENCVSLVRKYKWLDISVFLSGHFNAWTIFFENESEINKVLAKR